MVMVDRIQTFWGILVLNFNSAVIKEGMPFLFSVCLGTGVLLLKGFYVLYSFSCRIGKSGLGECDVGGGNSGSGIGGTFYLSSPSTYGKPYPLPTQLLSF